MLLLLADLFSVFFFFLSLFDIYYFFYYYYYFFLFGGGGGHCRPIDTKELYLIHNLSNQQ